MQRLSLASLLALMSLTAPLHAAPSDYFAIHVIDDATGRGVPLVELQTTFEARYITDSAGYIAFNEPGLMDGQEIWLDVRSYGYESPKAALGGAGVTLRPAAGKSAEIRLKRTNIAERLYRLTGYGIYRDSVLLGKRPPMKEPLLNARVTGQDTVQTAVYKGKYLWLWQDTDRAAFFLGCFSMTGATAPLPAKLDLNEGIDFTYFVDKPGEFARAMANVPQPEPRPIWVDGLTVVKDEKGQEKLLARYVAVDKSMRAVESGLVLYDDARQRFERFKIFPGDGEKTLALSGRPFYGTENGMRYAYCPNFVRVRADFASAIDPANYEGFTCLTDHGKGDDVQRRHDGKVDWRWEHGAAPPKQELLERLVKDQKLKPDDLPIAFRDVAIGKPVRLASGSIAWSAFLKKWTYVFHESHGASMLGEVWFATAQSPQGPWRDAVKIASHAMKDADNDFYNVIQHDELSRGDGRYVYFEGTFVNTFSGTKTPTPYYNYNNIMYRLDLSDPRLKLPQPPAGWTAVEP